MNLTDFKNIPFMPSALEAVYPHNDDINGKAERLVREGKLLRIRRGLYVVSPKVSGQRLSEFVIANHIYGPSYISMQSALRFYGLIPEAVYSLTSVTTKVSKTFATPLGNFNYTHASDPYYPIGVTSLEEEGAYFLMATREKALCDLIVFTPGVNLRYRKEIISYLEEDLRIDLADIMDFDIDLLRRIALVSRKKTTINTIIKIIEDGRNV